MIDGVIGCSDDDAFNSFLHTIQAAYGVENPQQQTQLHVDGLLKAKADAVIIRHSYKDNANPGLANTAFASSMLDYFQLLMVHPNFSPIYQKNQGLINIHQRLLVAMQQNPGGNIEFGHFLNSHGSVNGVTAVGKAGWMPTMTFREGGHPGFLDSLGYAANQEAIYASLVSVERIVRPDLPDVDVLVSAVFPHQGEDSADYQGKRAEIFGQLHSSLLSSI